ncbi:MmgE/PrpD family protein [Variovorax defluvii]|uniref:MmgE/PrpD family protein n=1 Tax=Variovorax defluvii TaxID=913761 RepID=A0ABP8HKR4_9BURK
MNVTCPPLEAAVVGFIQDFSLEHVTPPLRVAVSRVLRDQISSQIGNSRLPWSRHLWTLVEGQHMTGRSTVITTDRKMSATDAAFINASYAHGFEYDEGHRPSNSHPGSCAVATAIAVGEEVGATLDEVVTAILMGYEVYARIGVLAAPDLMQRGFHPASVLAGFGAAAVCAKLRGFDPETTLHALAIALSHASGAAEYSSTGGSVKRLHPGIGVRGGMFAADLAQAGITGPRAFLSGVKGFYRAFLQRDPGPDAVAVFGLSHRFEILRGGFKRYCCCGANHASIDILTNYAGRLGDIETVSLRIPKLCNAMVGTVNSNAYTPLNIEQVQFSLPTQAAFALLGYGNGYKPHLDYLEGELDMALVLGTAQKVRIVESPELDKQYPGKFVTEAMVNFVDGRSETRFVENSLGTPDNPMTEDAHDAKFLELTSEILGRERATRLLAVLHELGPGTAIPELAAMCAAR